MSHCVFDPLYRNSTVPDELKKQFRQLEQIWLTGPFNRYVS
jgi:hypothetical protein